MTLYAIIFYVVAALILFATALAITRRNAVHAVVYLIISFCGSAMLFYLLGAPFLAALEVIIYAGAIMVLFLFVVMILRVESVSVAKFSLRAWMPAVLLGFVFLALSALLLVKEPGSRTTLQSAMALPREFGRFLFQRYWLAVEIASLLLLIALVAAIQLGRRKGEGGER
jgi:NADH-quinone oxidoreductase subunit J